jgi:hypothetical protein
MTRAHHFRKLFSLLTLMLIACNSGQANKDLRFTLSVRGVEKITILEVPKTVSVPVMLTADKLESRYHRKLDLGKSEVLDQTEKLDRALGATECKPAAAATDLRTAVIFLGPDNKRIKTFYYGSDGKGGQVDSQPCDLSPGLYQWVRERLPE